MAERSFADEVQKLRLGAGKGFGAAADRLAAEVVEWTVREGAAAR